MVVLEINFVIEIKQEIHSIKQSRSKSHKDGKFIAQNLWIGLIFTTYPFTTSLQKDLEITTVNSNMFCKSKYIHIIIDQDILQTTPHTIHHPKNQNFDKLILFYSIRVKS